MPTIEEPLPFSDDPTLLVQVVARLASERMMADAARAGLRDLRESDGFVFQHLQGEALTITVLAGRLGITQQGASKAVADLERRGYVERQPSPNDARAKVVALTARGRAAITASRRSRRRSNDAIDRALGVRGAAAFRRSLVAVADELGGLAALEGRRLRPPT